MPIITLEVLPEDALVLLNEDGTFLKADAMPQMNATNQHIKENQDVERKKDDVACNTIESGVRATENNDQTKGKTELLEYVTRKDGSVICKLCGEILQSRTHWYRHKYKVHVINTLNPTPLFQCEQCLVYFKSRKGKAYDIKVESNVFLHFQHKPRLDVLRLTYAYEKKVNTK